MTEQRRGVQPGLIGVIERTVGEQHTAIAMGSGQMPVLATPMLVAWLEAAAQRAVEDALPGGQMSVGVHLDLHHHGATPIGMRVVATAELTAIEGRELTFRLFARDEKEGIAEGTHRRTISAEAVFNRLLRQKTGVRTNGIS